MPPKKNQGFTLVISIFIITILAIGVIYTVRAALITKDASVYALNRERAFYAAQSGAEWGVYQAVINSSCVNQTTFNMPTGSTGNESSLRAYSVTVSCVANTFTEGNDTYQVFEIASKAERGVIGTTDYTSRTVVVTATNI